ncbi:hypothetical protein RU86_GL000139 [Lactococcus piscium]|uniref:HTH cro/C1-type domain-containing protein n=2 Tax=Pseudolactococcus piscium TaxID=1364 RepID=A0A2A5S625_9LACT|nr:hypothetical protein RU86_GL000139 [Lactococcus piscium]
MADRKISLNHLSKKVGITTINLSKLKNERVSAVRFSMLDTICKALDCQPANLLAYQKIIKQKLLTIKSEC